MQFIPVKDFGIPLSRTFNLQEYEKFSQKLYSLLHACFFYFLLSA